MPLFLYSILFITGNFKVLEINGGLHFLQIISVGALLLVRFLAMRAKQWRLN